MRAVAPASLAAQPSTWAEVPGLGVQARLQLPLQLQQHRGRRRVEQDGHGLGDAGQPAGLGLVEQGPGQRLDLGRVPLPDPGRHRGRADLAAADRAGRQPPTGTVPGAPCPYKPGSSLGALP